MELVDEVKLEPNERYLARVLEILPLSNEYAATVTVICEIVGGKHLGSLVQIVAANVPNMKRLAKTDGLSVWNSRSLSPGGSFHFGAIWHSRSFGYNDALILGPGWLIKTESLETESISLGKPDTTGE